MLDIKWIRQHAEQVQETAKYKGIAVSIAELLLLDEQRRKLLAETEGLREERNQKSKQIAALVASIQAARKLSEEEDKAFAAASSTEKANIQSAVKAVNGLLAEREAQLEKVNQQFMELMELVPNIVSADTPLGESDADNVELRRVGQLPVFTFEPLDHVALGEQLGIIDIPRGVKCAGSRSYYLKGAGALLHRAVQQLAIDLLVSRGFSLMEVPLMVREEAMASTGFFPLGRDQTYGLQEDDKWLVGTAEVPLVAYYGGETLSLSRPVRMAAASACFRSEIGSAGRDVRGLYRVHQFSKVEQVVICRADEEEAEQLLQEITRNAEELLAMLELPYRVVAVCTGDMSQKTYKQYDIETWMPSRNSYGETHSSSNLLDFQARRSNIRYKDAEGMIKYAYTLNNTAVASPRILIPLLEAHQQEDGSVAIPAALQPYMNGITVIKPLMKE
ncbi:MAG: serine--tRNA ligase [Paenibacillus sp.]|nr:serine--tRNA ligase [Paenibacillus sp.]